MTDATWHDQPGATPLEYVPPDYYPAGSAAWFEIPDGRDAGKRLFVRDSVHGGDADGEPTADSDASPEHTVVFVHGNPENSYTWRGAIDHLDARADEPVRVVAMDHVGFGLSDPASYEMVCMDHARNLRQLIAAMDLRDVTLVIHDWGGPIGVGAFLEHPDRVANLVVTNSTVFPIPDDGYTYPGTYPTRILPWSRMPDVVPDAFWGDLASYAVFRSPCGPVRLLGGFAGHTALQQLGWVPDRDPLARRVFAEQFRHPVNARSSKRFVRQTRSWAEGNTYEEPDLGPRDTAPFYEGMQSDLPAQWGPDGREIGVRAVVGRWDPCGKASTVARWREALPQLGRHVTAFDDVGHFVEEEQPGAVAAAIRDVAGI
ncbi:MAG: alpha/beta fold hydrolase [Haloarculaceae archaeon]